MVHLLVVLDDALINPLELLVLGGLFLDLQVRLLDLDLQVVAVELPLLAFLKLLMLLLVGLQASVEVNQLLVKHCSKGVKVEVLVEVVQQLGFDHPHHAVHAHRRTQINRE